jgi:hypothetical protein
MNIPTAEEYLNELVPIGALSFECAIESMIEFAKLHVQAALDSIANGTLDNISSWDGNPFTGEGSEVLDRDKILNAYPLNNIK